MSTNSPFEAGDRVKVAERGLSGHVSERLSWIGKVVSVNFPWVRVRDERGTIYERHARTLRPVEARKGRTTLTSVGGQMAVIAPPRERPRMEFEMPEPTRRRRRKGPAELAGSGVAIAPARPVGRKKKASRLSELEGPSAEEKAAAKAFIEARREANRQARKKKEAEARRAARVAGVEVARGGGKKKTKRGTAKSAKGAKGEEEKKTRGTAKGAKGAKVGTTKKSGATKKAQPAAKSARKGRTRGK